MDFMGQKAFDTTAQWWTAQFIYLCTVFTWDWIYTKIYPYFQCSMPSIHCLFCCLFCHFYSIDHICRKLMAEYLKLLTIIFFKILIVLNRFFLIMSRICAFPGHGFQVGLVIGWLFLQSLLHLYPWISFRQDNFWVKGFVGGLVSLSVLLGSCLATGGILFRFHVHTVSHLSFGHPD